MKLMIETLYIALYNDNEALSKEFIVADFA